jgi:hypothetical protein
VSKSDDRRRNRPQRSPAAEGHRRTQQQAVIRQDDGKPPPARMGSRAVADRRAPDAVDVTILSFDQSDRYLGPTARPQPRCESPDRGRSPAAGDTGSRLPGRLQSEDVGADDHHSLENLIDGGRRLIRKKGSQGQRAQDATAESRERCTRRSPRDRRTDVAVQQLRTLARMRDEARSITPPRIMRWRKDADEFASASARRASSCHAGWSGGAMPATRAIDARSPARQPAFQAVAMKRANAVEWVAVGRGNPHVAHFGVQQLWRFPLTMAAPPIPCRLSVEERVQFSGCTHKPSRRQRRHVGIDGHRT